MELDITRQIEEKLRRSLPGATITVEDPMRDQTHLRATVVYSGFADMSLVEQHRSVMKLLENDFAENLHALALQTRVK